jgi:hypothetical protein
VTLINTDGMSFIGPGSEWFWTALSGIVLAVTFVAIYRQLRMQASMRALEQLEAFEREGKSEQLHQAALDVLLAWHDGTDPAQIPRLAAGIIGGTWEKYAMLGRSGHVDVKLLWRYDSEGPQGWWLLLAPRTRRRRAETGDQSILEDLEWLAGVFAALDRKHGRQVLGPDDIPGNLDFWIAAHEEGVREARALRTVYVASPEATPPTPALPTPTAAPQAVSD